MRRLAQVERFVKGSNKYKYTALMKDGTRVNFGHRDYEQYKDSVPKNMGGGLWSHKDHLDKERRRRYRVRHRGIVDKHGKPAYLHKYSPSWFSYNLLW